jgi:glycosyltransferase involved in cell wall biosynthesis
MLPLPHAPASMVQSKSPLISIGLPVYNGERFLSQAVESLLAQSTGDFELILSDNASEDGTEEICRAYEQQDARVRYFRQDHNLGAAKNYNFVVEKAVGAYFKWLAADDMCTPEFLEDCLTALEQDHGKAVLAFPRTRWIDEHGATLHDDGDLPWDGKSPHTRLRALLADQRDTHLHKCSPVCGLIRTEALRQTRLIGPFNSSDKVLLVELALLGDYIEVRRHHFLRRIHDESSLAANATKEEVAAWFDPTQGKKFPMPRNQLFRGYLTAIMRTPMAMGEKLRCYRVLARLFRVEWRALGGEYKIALRQKLAR